MATHAEPARAPRRLTRDQIAAFAEHGYLRPLPVFTPAEADANRAAFDRLLALFQAHGHDSYAINGYHATCASIHDLVTNPVLVDYAADLVGDDVLAWGTHFFCKLPGDRRAVSWHQDAPYWPLTPMRTVTVWLAIDDADEGNSAMRVIPGSHRLGPLPTRPSRPDERNVLWTCIDGVESLAAPVSMSLKAGEASLHHDLLVHGSEPNRSQRRRCGLTIRYAPTSVRAAPGWNENAVICRGSDPDGHWIHRPRPPGDSPVSDHRFIGGN